jgi:ornithine cyclodeaminase
VPLALLVDNHYITDARTAIAGALASDLLSRPTATCAAVLGSGEQARLQVMTLAGLRPLERVLLWARRPDAAEATANELRAKLPANTDVAVAATAREATEVADILITATASEEPLVEADWLRPGQHVTAIGADDHRKHELTSECFARADRIVVDLRAQTCAKAELARALEKGAANVDDILEIGEILANADLGRRSDEEITIAKLTGLAAQDLAAAKYAAERLELFL